MSKLDLAEIQHLAKLSNLRITNEEALKYPEQLSESIEYVKNLEELDISSVPDSFFTTRAINLMEEDEVRTSDMLTQEQALKNAQSTKNGYFIVKRIL
jgi:aspartyl-tRNA(Asn)/glutamyl-tRNA(Gln) amidotransferase subunit C